MKSQRTSKKSRSKSAKKKPQSGKKKKKGLKKTGKRPQKTVQTKSKSPQKGSKKKITKKKVKKASPSVKKKGGKGTKDISFGRLTQMQQSTTKKGKAVEWKQVEKFVESIAKDDHETRLYFLKETFKAAFKLAKEGAGTLNIKIAATALKELRFSFKMFFPHRNRQKITVFGSARSQPSDSSYQLAKEFAQQAVTKNFMIITGGGPGAMQAGNEGAGIHEGFGLNIKLPFEQTANRFIDSTEKLIHYKYFFTRKLFLIKEASALVVMPGGFGTFDEAFELLTLLQTGKSSPIPVVFLEPEGYGFWKEFWDFAGKLFTEHGLIDPHDLHLFVILHSAREAMSHIEKYYLNYHSIRQVKDKMVIRLKREPSQSSMEKLNQEFGYLSLSGKIEKSGPLEPEKNEPELEDLPRIVFPWARKDYAGLRMLIDRINELN